jgi:hypothetical protein
MEPPIVRYLLTHWLKRGSALLALTLMLGCAPATEKPATETEPAIPAGEQPADMPESATEMPANSDVGEDPMPEEDAAPEDKTEEKTAGADPLDTTSEDPNVKLGEPADPVDLK